MISTKIINIASSIVLAVAGIIVLLKYALVTDIFGLGPILEECDYPLISHYLAQFGNFSMLAIALMFCFRGVYLLRVQKRLKRHIIELMIGLSLCIGYVGVLIFGVHVMNTTIDVLLDEPDVSIQDIAEANIPIEVKYKHSLIMARDSYLFRFKQSNFVNLDGELEEFNPTEKDVSDRKANEEKFRQVEEGRIIMIRGALMWFLVPAFGLLLGFFLSSAKLVEHESDYLEQ